MKTVKCLVGMMAFSLGLASLCFARGADGSGGGHAVGNELLDFYEVEQVESFQLKNQPAYKTVTLPILQRIGSILPDFEQVLEDDADSKAWRFAKNGIECTDAQTSAGGKKIPVACQNEREVRFDWSWLKKQNAQTQGYLFLHEMLRAEQLKNHEITDYDLRALVRTLADASNSISSTDLQNQLNSARFGNYMTIEQRDGGLGVLQMQAVIKSQVCDVKPPREKATEVFLAVNRKAYGVLASFKLSKENAKQYLDLTVDNHDAIAGADYIKDLCPGLNH